MAKFDRYMLSQLLLFFGFFALVLVAVFWISRSVRLFDRLIADGQSVLVFLEFTALGLPRIVLLVLPIAAFAASVYVTNRLSNESEITVMQATGSSPWRLARPVFLFGCLVALMVTVLAHVLVPLANAQLDVRENEVNQDTTARFLVEGTFVHPSTGVTLYTRTIDDDGVLQGVFLSDRRAEPERAIYTAQEAYLLREDGRTSLIMLDGIAQRYASQTRRLSVATFNDFAYDISDIVSDSAGVKTEARAMTTAALMQDWQTIAKTTRQRLGVIAEEFHARFAQPIFTLAAAVFGFSVLIARGFSRFGIWREVLIAFALLLMLDSLRAALSDQIQSQPASWPLAYLPGALGLALSAIALMFAARPFRVQRRGAA